MRDSFHRDSQFSIRVRFADSVNGYIRRVRTRYLLFWFTSGAIFLTKSKDADYYESINLRWFVH